MSLDTPMNFNLCPVCEKRVEDYAPGVSYVTVNGEAYHPKCAPEETRGLVHAYTRKTGESVEIVLADNGNLIFDVDGEVILVEKRSRGRAFTPRTAAKRAIEYEQQDHAEYDALIASNTVTA